MKLNLTSTIICKSELKENWQMVYASQLYGTFFAVYAKINADETNKQINTIDLKLINYKGPINLGIHRADYNQKRKKYRILDHILEKSIEVNLISITLWVHGLSDRVSLEEPITVNCDAEDSYLEINRKLLPLSKDDNLVVNGVFDSEFYYRDGLGIPTAINSEEVDGLATWPDFNNPDYNSGEMELAGPGGICPRGYAKITF